MALKDPDARITKTSPASLIWGIFVGGKRISQILPRHGFATRPEPAHSTMQNRRSPSETADSNT